MKKRTRNRLILAGGLIVFVLLIYGLISLIASVFFSSDENVDNKTTTANEQTVVSFMGVGDNLIHDTVYKDALQEDAAVAFHLERVLRPRLWSLELDMQLAITEVLACLYRPRAWDDDNRAILYLPFRIDRPPVLHRRTPLRQVLAVEQDNRVRRRLARLLGRHHFGRFRRIPFRTLWGHMPTFLRCRGERHAAQCAYQ